MVARMRSIDLHQSRSRRYGRLPALATARNNFSVPSQPDVHFGDFVQQQRAAMGRLELAKTAGDSAGEGSFLVAEQFGFLKRFSGMAAQFRAMNGPPERGVICDGWYRARTFLAGARTRR